jgi:hypothetical protein
MRRRLRRLRNIALVTLIIVVLISILRKAGIVPSFADIFRAKAVTIDETPVLIKEIRSIGQIITATAYDEVVVDSVVVTNASRIINSINAVSPFPVFPSSQKQIVIIAKGKILAGTDLNLLTNESLRVSKDTVWLQLPATKIIDAIMNPSDFETFEEKGTWTNEEVTAVKLRARQKMIDRALGQNIIERASAKSKSVMESFLRAAGFKTVVVS